MLRTKITEFTKIIGGADNNIPYIVHKTETIEININDKNEISFVRFVFQHFITWGKKTHIPIPAAI